ncbi:MAG: T9SS type A sorting domain-containing protein [Aureispira sp.]|nr:T9SS type A sorting domain-containing protein [Aureispira sp.]
MQKLLWTSLLFFYGVTIILSQVYEPLIRENTYWDENHGSGQHICFLSGGDRFYFEGDTIFNSIQYKILRAHPLYEINAGPYCPPFGVDYNTSSIKAFMREDTSSRQVILLGLGGASIPTELVLFDFSLNAGDTLYSLGVPFPIDSVKTVTLLNGAVRKKWFVQSSNNAYYIEGIGGSEGIRKNFEFGLGFWEIPMCVTENNLSLWGNECSTILNLDRMSSLRNNKVFPNPVGNILRIERSFTSPVDFKMYDLYGRVVLMKTLHSSIEEIDVSNLPKGMYVFDLNGKESQKIIKK